MPDTETTTAAAETARAFKLDPDAWVDITCPECDHTVSITDGNVFQIAVGEPLTADATLGDLIDAASAHVCGQGTTDA